MDADSGLVHTVTDTSGNVGDVIEANSLLHGQETDAFGAAGNRGVEKCLDVCAGQLVDGKAQITAVHGAGARAGGVVPPISGQ